MTPQIQFKDFSFRYLNLQDATLKNINLEIFPGEKILIVGRSGSGKSTLLQCLNGLIPHSYPGEISGSLKIEELALPAKSIFASSQKVGTILQDQDSQFIGLTVAEDIAFTLENNALETSTMQQIVEHSLQQVAMTDYANYSPGELSGGQKQHIALAGILASAPAILLFDEPLANLDPASAQDAINLIRQLNQQSGKTVIIAEHRVEECLDAGIDRIIIMDNGMIVANGTPAEILANDYLTTYGIRPPLYHQLFKMAEIAATESLCVTTTQEIDNLSELTQIQLRKWYQDQQLIKDNLFPAKSSSKSMLKTPPVLTIKNLSCAYTADKPVLKNLSAEFYPGEIVSILGNNGAGKSTLSYAISGLIKPLAGEITLEGVNIANWGIKHRGEKIGLIMQNPNLMIIMTTVIDEVASALKAQGLAAETITQRTSEALKTCGLWGYRNWPITALSYGQKKRVTIAALLVQQPRVLILDEPTAGQDLQTYHEFMSFIRQLAQSEIAIIIITHDLYLALEYSNRCVVIANGEKIADNSAIEVLCNAEILTAARLRPLALTKLAELIKILPAALTESFVNHSQNLETNESEH